MAQRRHHYERAFEQYLRVRRIPYVAVDEARKALLPDGIGSPSGGVPDAAPGGGALKSFDFVIYGDGLNLLVDIKGRRVVRRRAHAGSSSTGRLETWVTQEDVDSLRRWEHLFGGATGGFEGAFVFVYWCDDQPPDALFQEVFEYQQRWYALRAVTLADYAAAMKPRSARWRTVHLPTAAFERLSHPFASASIGGRRVVVGPDLPALQAHGSSLGSL